jgi:hypothetical protein
LRELPTATPDFQGQKCPPAMLACVIIKFKNTLLSSAVCASKPEKLTRSQELAQKTLKIFHQNGLTCEGVGE